MPLLDRMERKLGWLSFPGLFRFYVLLGVLAFALSWFRPDLAIILEFDRGKIMEGEVWRLVTFLFASSALSSTGFFAIIFLYFAVIIGFLINDSLEEAWGAFRTSIFFYAGYLSLLACNLILPSPAWGGSVFYTSAFFAFATLFPRYEFLLFFILPVQVRFLAMISAALIILMIIGQPILLPFMVLAYLNYILWVGIPFFRDRKSLMKAAGRRKQFEKSKLPEAQTFHRCEVCGRTENDPATLSFRVGDDGKEYCTEHLPGDADSA
jgi:hypothetical protein